MHRARYEIIRSFGRTTIIFALSAWTSIAAAQETAKDTPKTPKTAEAPDLPAPPRGKANKAAPKDDISPEEWNRAEWALVQPERRALVEIDGFFRLRGTLLRKLDFRNDSVTEYD